MSESLFDQIAQDTSNYYTDQWRNGKVGAISDHKGENIYKFYEAVWDEKGKLRDVYLNNPERENSAPIMAAGIAAYWIHHRKSANRLTSLFSKPEQFAKSIREQFEAYTNIRFSQFKKQNKDNPDTWDWDGEYEFYCKYIIPHEMRLSKLSEAIFEYVTEDDAKELRKVMDNYIEFLKARRKELGYDISDELKVLRAFDSRDEYQFEDLSEDEIIVILDRLEADKCVKVAWISGHKWAAVRLLPQGKVYMKRLLEQSRIKTNGEKEIDLLRKRVAVFPSPTPMIDTQANNACSSAHKKALTSTPNPKQSKEEHLQQRIATLEKELDEARDMLKQKNAQLKELQQENEQLRSQLDDDEEPDEEISLHDKVRLELLLQLMIKDGADLNKHGNKVKAAQVMQAITNLPITTCKNYCSNQDLSTYAHEKEILMFNTKLRVLGMQTSL